MQSPDGKMKGRKEGRKAKKAKRRDGTNERWIDG
jgi:hypothetical protein